MAVIQNWTTIAKAVGSSYPPCIMLLIMSDIHGDVARFKRTLVTHQGIRPEDVYVLGDLVEWAMTPQENDCVSMTREFGFGAVRGNHEDIAVSIRELLADNAEAMEAYQAFSGVNTQYMADLPVDITRGGYLFAHTVPPGSCDFVHDLTSAERALRHVLGQRPGIRVCFIGHSHEPGCFFFDSTQQTYGEHTQSKVRLAEDRVYVVKPGSLGERKVGSYLLADPDTHVLEWREA